jgi:hypothetical protein
MMKADEPITRTVELVEVVAGDPPAIVTRERLVGMGGRTRTFTQKIAVVDPTLYRRLLRDVTSGDGVEVTTATDWSAAGARTYLVDFGVVPTVAEHR